MIHFENWKNGKWIVNRVNGKRTTWRKLKGSNIKTKAEAAEILSKTGSFRLNVIKVKNKSVKVKQRIISRTKLGTNTIVVRTKTPLRNEKHFQHITIIYWPKGQKTIGYSKLQGTLEQSIHNSIQAAIRDRIITYEYVIDIAKGIAIPPNPKHKTLNFKVKHEVATYVKAKGQWS
jgi:hypothetical protein